MIQEPDRQPVRQPEVAASEENSVQKRWHTYIHRRLLMRLAIPAVIGLVMLWFAAGDMLREHVPVGVALWLTPGLVLGYPLGRLNKVMWDSEATQIVPNGNSFVVMAAYMAVRFGSRFALTSARLDLPYVGSIAALLGIGLLFGRSLGMAGSIRNALRSTRSAAK